MRGFLSVVGRKVEFNVLNQCMAILFVRIRETYNIISQLLIFTPFLLRPSFRQSPFSLMMPIPLYSSPILLRLLLYRVVL